MILESPGFFFFFRQRKAISEIFYNSYLNTGSQISGGQVNLFNKRKRHPQKKQKKNPCDS
jgi:hypothetical protein